MTRLFVVALFTIGAASAAPTGVRAQTPPEQVSGGVGPGVLALNRAQARMDEGRIREARVELTQWWELYGAESREGELQRALWLRGLLTVDPRIADVDFRRLIQEFPDGSYTGGARLRLAQSAHAQGDLDGAREQFIALERDYPGTGLRLAARAWLDRYAPGTVRQREAPPPPPDPDTVTMPAARVAVELGRFRDRRVAGELLARAESAGLVARVVPTADGFHSVRMGRYDSAPLAGAARARARGLGFPARLVPLAQP